jgi:class 3 adenylate cyclase
VSAAGAVAFVDVVGFTASTERYGDDHALAIVDRMEQVTRDALPEGALLVKLLGDGALVWFTHAAAAVPAAIRVVHDLAGGQPKVPARAGVHYGHVLWRDGDVIGRDVNVAARLVDLARAYEVLCSATARAASDPAQVRFATRGAPQMPGIDRRIHVFAATRHVSDGSSCCKVSVSS